jgi:cytochrome d ubiquinol oxidase subunit II
MTTFLGLDFAVWWYLVIGATVSLYAVLDGFDLGAGLLHPFFRKEESRRIALNAVGPVWDGNEVWLVITGGALFAGFPEAYATAFSAFYTPFFLLLAALIGRAVSIEFRSKEPMAWWRKFWDWSYFLASLVISILLGVALGNLMIGIPVDAEGIYQGAGLLDMLKPLPLAVGLTVAALYAVHGSLYLLLKTEDRLFERVRRLNRTALLFFYAAMALSTALVFGWFPEVMERIWERPGWMGLAGLAFILSMLIPLWVNQKRFTLAFLSSALMIMSLLGLVFAQQFPLLIPSPIDPDGGMSLWEAASSERTLRLLLIITLIGGPLVVGYFVFVYRAFRGKVRLDDMSY